MCVYMWYLTPVDEARPKYQSSSKISLEIFKLFAYHAPRNEN